MFSGFISGITGSGTEKNNSSPELTFVEALGTLPLMNSSPDDINFGGSDIVMIFQEGVKAELVCPGNDSGDGYAHLLMGEPYMTLSK